MLAIDIGKTNSKIAVVRPGGEILFERKAPFSPRMDGPYPHIDADAIWEWLEESIAAATKEMLIDRICVAAHGAAAALITETGLAAPILDYEWEGVRDLDAEYDKLRPAYVESGSPDLPGGLNLGRQLFWLSRCHSDWFERAWAITPFAQYWSWRMSGVAASEVSTIGCHSDLWAPREAGWSSLAIEQGWSQKFAKMTPAWRALGSVDREFARRTGLPVECVVLTGVHDSNASLAPYLRTAPSPTVVSTGTWVVTMVPGGDLSRLDSRRDMLANVDITGAPVACARFMGGREYAAIASATGRAVDETYAVDEVGMAIGRREWALPDFSAGSGPFSGRSPRIVGDSRALCDIYLALMMDLELDLIGSTGQVIIDGVVGKNEIVCGLIAALRPDQAICVAPESIAHACLAVADWDSPAKAPPAVTLVEAIQIDGLHSYRDAWRNECARSGGSGDA